MEKILQNNVSEKHFILFPNCIPVKGAMRSLICDIQNMTFKFIPNDLFELIINYNGCSRKALYEHYSVQNRYIIGEYFDFLESNELIYWCEKYEVDNFLPFDLKWDEPTDITNAIIDYGNTSTYNIEFIFEQLEKLSCRDIQIRFYSEICLSFLDDIFQKLMRSRIKSIQLIIKYSNTISKNEIFEFCDKHRRISVMYVHSSPEFTHRFPESGSGIVYFLIQSINSSSHCGIISENDFAVNIKTFTESLKHNSCLNRKICIDINGDIKNCPSMPESFGNIKDTTLAEALAKKGFKKYWGITKDKIAVCKDCEFRYICTDCRAYRENPDDIYSKPLKCGYDPYMNKWEEWSTNPLKQKAMECYGMSNIEQMNS